MINKKHDEVETKLIELKNVTVNTLSEMKFIQEFMDN